MLRISNLSKTYSKGGVRAVDDLTIHVKAGEIFGFLGPNGAGKTTMIKMIVGLLNPDDGRIVVNGHDVSKEPVAAKACIGYVPDNPDLFDKLTGVEYLNFMGDVYGVPTDVRKERLERLLGMFELEDAVPDLVGSYSHGMKQKLALTGALLSKPKLLMLDEPMVGLDPKSSHLFKELMNRHCQEGGTVFFSTHILEVAERICHRVGIIDHGRLIACGTMEELRSRAVAGADSAFGKSLEDLFLELTEGERR
ncbi:MAG: ABC transporter ATP-binding protein [Bacillota bacterium]|jgi:ABC-2 type transport system ATP-binding protein|nr:ABC transporter ATP-binding protein [Bacillota bacterium]